MLVIDIFKCIHLLPSRQIVSPLADSDPQCISLFDDTMLSKGPILNHWVIWKQLLKVVLCFYNVWLEINSENWA